MPNTHPPDGYPAGHHRPSHHQQHNHQPYYAPPHQQPAPPPHMYQAQPQHQQPNNYYAGGAPPVGAPQIPPAGYYSPPPPQQYAHQQQYGQPPPPGYAPHQPYGQPQYTNTTYPPQHQQPQQQYPASATGNNFAPPSQPTQYQQLPPPGSTYPQAYAQAGHTNMSHQNGHPYGQQYAAPPTNNNNGTNANGNAYAQQPAMYSNPSYSQQQPYQQHRPSNGYSSGVPSAQSQYPAPPPPPQAQQPYLYPGQSYPGATTSSSGSGNGTEGVLLNQGSYPGASAPSQSPGNSIITGLQKVCASGLPIIEGDPCRAPIKLRIEEKIMEASGDSFYVTDAKKKILYNVDGSRTPDQHKILKSAKGRPLLQMRQFSTVAKKIVITNMNSEPVATLEKARVDSNTHKRIDATIHCNNTRFIIAGNSQASSFKVENARMDVVAEIARASRSMKKIFSGQDSYTADVTAGSPAFLVMVVVAIDEIFCDG